MSAMIQQWAAANGLKLPPTAPPDQLSLTIDRVRVHLVTFRSGEILVEARVRDLPSAPAEQAALLRKALALSTARMAEVAAGPVVDPACSFLKLQARVPAQSGTEELDKAVSVIVNEVEFWRGVL
ncbi:MAG: hypothetical protein EBT33_01830 [Betaproteobacteria bacterium]|jgi:hypothetical protein|nr:hypothetical protein [Betaproteobacteria bacterium]